MAIIISITEFEIRSHISKYFPPIIFTTTILINISKGIINKIENAAARSLSVFIIVK